jgi:ankyrin repeat protein
MGFLHLGWDIAAKQAPPPGEGEEGAAPLAPEWEAAALEIDLNRPGLLAVRNTMGWTPLHMAAMEGKTALIRRLVTEFDSSLTQRAANSWTPLHYAAAHNQVSHPDYVRIYLSGTSKT